MCVADGIERRLAPGVDLVLVAGGGGAEHVDHAGRALGGQDVVQRVVGVVANGQVVGALGQNVGLGVGVVELPDRQAASGILVLLGLDLEGLGGAGVEQLGLVEGHHLDSGLLDLVLLLVVSVGGLGIDLDDGAAGDGAGVGDGHAQLIGVVCRVVGHAVGLLVELGVGQAVTEGVSDLVVVVPGRARGGPGGGVRLPLAEHAVLVAGLVVLVAYIDAFLINHVGLALCGHIAALNIAFVGGGGEVPHSGGAEVVVAVGIDQAAGGVDLAGQDLGNGVDAGDAHVTDPQRGVDVVLVVLEEIDLQGVGGVDQHDGLFDDAVLLHLGNVLQHGLLVLVERQIVDIAVGKVSALAANAGEGDDGGIAVLGNAVLHIVGVDIPRHFSGDLTGGGDGAALGAGVVLACADGVEVPQGGVDGHTDLLEGSAQGVGGGGINVAGAGAAVHEVDTAVGEGADLGIGSQRQCIVVVHQQGSAFSLDLLGQGQTVVDHLLGRVEVTGVILGVGVLVLQLPEAAAEAGRHGVVELYGKHGQRHGNDHNDRTQDRQDLPRQNVLALCLFVGFFERFLLGFDLVHDSLLVFSLTVYLLSLLYTICYCHFNSLR